jgi:hypothetical protein
MQTFLRSNPQVIPYTVYVVLLRVEAPIVRGQIVKRFERS